jgi:hypothetical protein
MFDLYQGSETASHRQAHLLHEVAADRLARSASDSHASSDDRLSAVRKVSRLVSDAVAAVSAAVATATRRPRTI